MVTIVTATTERLTASHRWTWTRDLLFDLVARDIKLRYRGSVLGVLWTLLNPLAELLVLMFVFDKVLHVDIPHFSATSHRADGLRLVLDIAEFRDGRDRRQSWLVDGRACPR